MKTALACHGKLDVLINNAGIIELGSIETTSLEQFDRLINTNVRYVIYNPKIKLLLLLLSSYKSILLFIIKVNVSFDDAGCPSPD